MKDLGWANAGGETERIINEWLKRCNIADHQRSDVDEGGGFRGLDHHVICQKCGFEYHYDSSD